MSEFKYIDHYITDYAERNLLLEESMVALEQAHQLKRIADCLEWQKPFVFWNGIFHRSRIAYVDEETCENENGSFGFIVWGSNGRVINSFAYKTNEEAEAARVEFMKLWEGK